MTSSTVVTFLDETCSRSLTVQHTT